MDELHLLFPRGVADFGDPDRFVEIVFLHQFAQFGDFVAQLRLRHVFPLIGVEVDAVAVVARSRRERLFEISVGIPHEGDAGKQHLRRRIDGLDRFKDLFQQFGVVFRVRRFAPRAVAVGFVDHLVGGDLSFVASGALGDVPQEILLVAVRRADRLVEFAAQNRDHGDALLAGLLDQRVPTCEIPFARLRFHLRPVEIDPDHPGAQSGHICQLPAHFLRRHPVQVRTHAERRSRGGQAEGGRPQRTEKQLIQFHNPEPFNWCFRWLCSNGLRPSGRLPVRKPRSF